MSNLVQLKDNNPVVSDYFKNPEMIHVLKQTVARGASDQEFAMFGEICKASGLNPFKKEIWFIKTNAGPQIMTGINGYLRIANSHPQFDGMEEDLIRDDKGDVVGAICKVYRKDRRYPHTAEVYLDEYQKNTPIWRSMKKVMIKKVAKSVALREAFPQELNGLYTAEEMPPEYDYQEPVKEITIIDINKEKKLNHIQKLIDGEMAWGYAPEELDGEELFQARRKITDYLHNNNIIYLSDRQNKCIWVDKELVELAEYCIHNPEKIKQDRDALEVEDIPQ